ncbi:MAG: cytochrome c biogenesis protein CcsA [Actinomycetota bacterium]|nr:cytochrome c biogenesis protein CcsA [Actinomycetota bacterium]
MSDAAVATRPDRRLTLLAISAWTAIAIALILIFFVAREANAAAGGQLQRIFYVHVPSALVGYLGFSIAFIASIAYLRTSERRWDLLAHASVEIGVVFMALVLITGPIWGRPVWGTWWQWDARLTSTLVLWLTYVGYLFLRSLTPDKARAGRLAAVVAIIGFLDVPLVHFSVYWWRTLHPQGPTPFDPERASGLGVPELSAFFVALGGFVLLFAWLLAVRVRLGRAEDQLDAATLRRERGRMTAPRTTVELSRAGVASE